MIHSCWKLWESNLSKQLDDSIEATFTKISFNAELNFKILQHCYATPTRISYIIILQSVAIKKGQKGKVISDLINSKVTTLIATKLPYFFGLQYLCLELQYTNYETWVPDPTQSHHT